MAKRKAKSKATTKKGAAKGDELGIEELKKKHKELHDEKVRVEANLKTSKKALERLKDKARKEYGTDDVDELRRKLAEMKAENEKRRREYGEHLAGIEKELAKVEKEHQAAEAEANGDE